MLVSSFSNIPYIIKIHLNYVQPHTIIINKFHSFLEYKKYVGICYIGGHENFRKALVGHGSKKLRNTGLDCSDDFRPPRVDSGSYFVSIEIFLTFDKNSRRLTKAKRRQWAATPANIFSREIRLERILFILFSNAQNRVWHTKMVRI